MGASEEVLDLELVSWCEYSSALLQRARNFGGTTLGEKNKGKLVCKWRWCWAKGSESAGEATDEWVLASEHQGLKSHW